MRPEKEVLRFSRGQRIQHIILFSSLIVLALTGLALRFHENLVARTLIALEGGIELRGLIHRIAAAALLLVVAGHFIQILFGERGHREFMAIVPRAKDIRNSWTALKHNMGISKERPMYDRYTGLQKLQYWAVVLGVGIMILTGFLLWFPSQAMAVMPKWLMDITLIVHGYQGTLVFMVLFLWHLYNVHVRFGRPFFNWAWLTGRIPLSELKEIHPAEYERLLRQGELRDE
ncbi:MAG: cytochrome b/b6 domain-containing protein [Candidatus Eisenbacteria bacterium]|nr:cytochrome b/b6 domain-containing protein [Candidatus Eisenbacteria bacterium]